jgi:hypothetical protein
MTGINGTGGGIYNNTSGILTLINSTVSGNTVTGSNVQGGGGIYNGGKLTLSNSTVSGNTVTGINGTGGGIYNGQGELTLNNSTISGNTATDGGGIYYFGGLLSTLTLTNSTITGNTAMLDCGGILIQSFTYTGSQPSLAQTDLTFSTIYGNRAYARDDIAIEDIDGDNYKPIKQISQVRIRNSIVVGDPAHPGPDIMGMLTSFGYNLFQVNSGATFDPATSKQHGTDKSLSANVLSKLFVTPVGLRNNGGLTMTYALASNSPALDAIPLQDCHIEEIFNDQSRMYTDQRGVKRPDGNEQFCDIGAFEDSG